MVTINSGGKSSILAALQNGDSVWVRGRALAVAKKMANAGLLNYHAEVVTDVSTSRSHEEFHIWLQETASPRPA